ncbi:MAG: diacylglycerol kinase family protein [Acidimicrobiales bacterium]
MSSPIVLVNPGSGPKETPVDDLTEAFGDLAEVRATTGQGLAVDVARAVDAGAPWVGVAGGDGSQRIAAPILAAAQRPLLAVPCGTRNHFAKDLGLDTIEAAVLAAKAGDCTQEVDLAWVGHECFLNTCNLGMYTAIVKERVRQKGKLPKRVADGIGIVREAVKGSRLRLVLDGRPVTTWAVFIGNSCYGDNVGSLGREALDDGLLDVRIVLANQKVARLRLFGALLGGRLHRTPVMEQLSRPDLEVVTPGCSAMDVAVDGDVFRLRTPLRLRIDRHALTVLTAPPQTG